MKNLSSDSNVSSKITSEEPIGLNFNLEQASDSINFDENNLAAGTIVTDQFDGVEFSSSSEFGLMLFDTNNVTGQDCDLSATDLGNVLIISEDGDASDPDDNAAGGTISLELDDLATVNSIGLLDIDEPGSSITFYDDNSNPIETVEIENLGNNSFQEIDFDVSNVASLDIDLTGSGAVTGIDFDPAQANTYSNIYAFGDSLVDTGNLFNVTTAAQEASALLGLDIPVIPPSPPYFEGRFSNGEIWIDNLADELNIDLTPATELSVVSPGSDVLSPVTVIEGNPAVSPFFNGNTTNQSVTTEIIQGEASSPNLSVNFAYGLATTGANGAGELGSFVPGMEQQVDFFVQDHLQANQAADPNALYVLWGGSNDYLGTDANPEEVVDNIETEVESLYDSGARDFLVVNLPDLGAIPEANNPNLSVSPAELTELSDTHNSLLDSGVEELEDSLTGADITILDVNSLFDDVLANPEEFGLTNVTEPFLDPITLTPTAGANPDEYLFYDTLHPTEAGQALISDFALETLAIEAEY